MMHEAWLQKYRQYSQQSTICQWSTLNDYLEKEMDFKLYIGSQQINMEKRISEFSLILPDLDKKIRLRENKALINLAKI